MSDTKNTKTSGGVENRRIYNELIKDFKRTRDYLREFYVYGFRTRDEYTQKSSRAYDDERRRIESWLNDYMQFRKTKDGKSVFISIDSRISRHNPLYAAWKTKSFTDFDISFYFIIMDILYTPEVCLPLEDIVHLVDDYTMPFRREKECYDNSTIRKKLNEYIGEGIIVGEKRGKTMYYRRSDDYPACSRDILDYFSEITPCGVIGSYLLDHEDENDNNGCFAFKHHYITGAMDSEIIYELFKAMRGKLSVSIEAVSRSKSGIQKICVVPLKIMVSVQHGRQYLMAYVPESGYITSYRTDYIVSVKPGDICDNFIELRGMFDNMLPNMWGVMTGKRIEHVEFTLHFDDEETFIPQRLEREKRCGTVDYPGSNTCRFTADVYNIGEMIPWIRTFIGRITDISFSDKALEERFRKDIEEMYSMYEIEGGEENDIQ